jgi:hypothetical protein
MAANPKSPTTLEPMDDPSSHYHVYHAEAHVISGFLKHPIKQPIEPQGHVVIEKTRREGHITRVTDGTSLEGLITFKSGHTRASGNKIQKKDLWGRDHSGYVTLSTSVIEGLNVFEVITADRVVAQVSTEHPYEDGHVPKVTFLGTRFENLRIGGYPVELEFDLAICGGRPENDRPYLEDTGFLDRVGRQYDGILSSSDVPDEIEKSYKSKITDIGDLRKRTNGKAKKKGNGCSSLHCSLVKSIGPIPIPGAKTFGNIIFIPDFGTVSLAEVEVGIEPSHPEFEQQPADSNYFTLNMLNMQLGCIGGGSVKAGTAKTNGMTRP